MYKVEYNKSYYLYSVVAEDGTVIINYDSPAKAQMKCDELNYKN